MLWGESKHIAYYGAPIKWSEFQFYVDGVTLTEQTHVDTYKRTYATTAEATYGSNTDGHYRVAVYVRAGDAAIRTGGPTSNDIYYIGITGVNAYAGCAAYAQFEIASDASSQQPLKTLTEIRSVVAQAGAPIIM